ncbi:hypothetical protein PTE30175_04379 [Pandoraea terrae]|uniref:Uncharacterized protein n=1 Tax=Pandoraea terrae TaxID=1537710 RepID=A0A5E4YFV2_9BURK|nr:hypothetical protein PTE30175_04379 [Pandoraea terrae]
MDARAGVQLPVLPIDARASRSIGPLSAPDRTHVRGKRANAPANRHRSVDTLPQASQCLPQSDATAVSTSRSTRHADSRTRSRGTGVDSDNRHAVIPRRSTQPPRPRGRKPNEDFGAPLRIVRRGSSAATSVALLAYRIARSHPHDSAERAQSHFVVLEVLYRACSAACRVTPARSGSFAGMAWHPGGYRRVIAETFAIRPEYTEGFQRTGARRTVPERRNPCPVYGPEAAGAVWTAGVSRHDDYRSRRRSLESESGNRHAAWSGW